MPFKGDYNRPGGPQKQRTSNDHRGSGPRRSGTAAKPERSRPSAPSRAAAPAQQAVEEKQPGLLTSPDNDKARFLRNLQSKKDRYAAKHFLVEGVRLVEEALRAPKPPLYTLYDADALNQTPAGQHLLMRLIEMLADKKGAFPATPRIMEYVCDTVSPQGVAAAVPFVQWQPEELAAAKLHIVLDQLQDPGNLGTILRSAGGAGDTAVLLTEGSVDFYSPKVVRAGMGAHFRVPAAFDQPWPSLVERLKAAGVEQIFLADSDADDTSRKGRSRLTESSYFDIDWTKPSAVIIGNEAHGASAEARNAATHLLSIPMPGGAESLNASVAASLIIFEALRHRLS